jgi:hypothetical protein
MGKPGYMDQLDITPNGGERASIQTDYTTVWINGATSLLGRFGPRGVDVHTDSLCDDCKTGEPDWEHFKAKMLEVHGVTVIDRYQPDWSKEAA